MLSPLLIAALLVSQAPSGQLLTLEQVLERAEEQNDDLAAARARLKQARQLSSKAWSGYLPHLSVGASFTHNSFDDVLFPAGYVLRDTGGPAQQNDPGSPGLIGTPSSVVMQPIVEVPIMKQDQYGGQVQLTQAILVPALWPAIRGAGMAEDAAEAGVEAARREILFAATELYYGIVNLKEATAVQEKMLQIQKDHERDHEVRFASGTTPKIALVRAQLDRSYAERDLKRTENALAGARAALAALVHVSPDFDVARPAAPTLPVEATALSADAVEQRPDIIAARHMLDASRAQSRSAWWLFAPNVGATGTWQISNVAGFTGEKSSWAIMLGLNWSIFDGGAREASIREASGRVAEAEAALRGGRAKAAAELSRALLDYDSAMANREKAEETVRLARENMTLVEVSMKSGTSTALELADANQALTGAELGAISESLNADLAALRVMKAAGQYSPAK